MEYVAEGNTRETLKKVMEKSYNDIIDQMDKPHTVYAGREPYQRSADKIGRNDLCPCGSGKKYKQCCGK